MTRPPCSAPRLYAITDHQLGDNLLNSVEAALAGGVEWVQYRDKSEHHTRRHAEASALVALCRRYSAKLLINDDVELARQVHADGVHLGQGDGDPRAARQRLGAQALIGITCHDSLTLAQTALDQGADYVAFGRFFPSTTKPEAVPAPLALLTEARARFAGLPLVAIGGITADNGAQVLAAGATTLAVSQGLFGATDIRATAQQLRQL